MGHGLRRESGFTIVELLIVIIVIGILAALILLGYNNIQTQARNTQAVDAARKGYDLIDSYYGNTGSYPKITNGDDAVCIGTAFKDYNGDGIGDCWDANGNGSNSAGNVTRHVDNNFLKDLSSTGSFSDSSTYPVFYVNNNVSFVGPVFMTPAHIDSGGHYAVRYWQNKQSDCPIGRRTYIFANNIVECSMDFPDR